MSATGQVIRHFLLVEDNPADAALMREAVLDLNAPIDIRVIHDGQEALDHLTETRRSDPGALPALIVLDLNLPGLAGREVLEQLKRDRDLRRIPVVVLSTSSAVSDVQDCYALQASSYITKPVDYDSFVGVVRSITDYWLRCASLPSEAPG